MQSQALACRRYPVAKLLDRIPVHMLERLEQDQQIASCCRHPENHDIEAWYSDARDAEKGMAPDIYIFMCKEVHEDSIRPNGERWHSSRMVGSGERPTWEVR